MFVNRQDCVDALNEVIVCLSIDRTALYVCQ